jgi:hypothetical protein
MSELGVAARRASSAGSRAARLVSVGGNFGSS